MNQDKVAVRVKGISKAYRLRRTAQDQLIAALKKLTSIFKWKKLNITPSNSDDFYALKDISFDILKGESWGFIGVNGSGKSTLLKIISGNLRPSSGCVEVDGKVVILDYGSGFNGEFTGKENIYMKATLLGLTKKQIQERYQSIIDFAELGDFINQPVKTYSSGMVSRLGFSLIAHVDADIIISDEALAVGDVFFVQKCMDFIREFLKRGTFLYVTHSTNDVLSLCQRAIWLERGVVKEIGTPANVIRAYLDKAHLDSAKNSLKEKTNIKQLNDNHVAEININSAELSQYMHFTLPTMGKDLRLRDLNYSCLRNDIQILPNTLIPSSGFGGATILSFSLSNEKGEEVSWIIGGENIILSFGILAEKALLSPIAGFQIFDSLGQVIFASNSNFLNQNQKILIEENTIFHAEFKFQMPALPVGQYQVRLAIAVSEEGNAILLQTIDEAAIVNSVQSYLKQGLIGIPLHSMFSYTSEREHENQGVFCQVSAKNEIEL